jgi:UPF0176 protein
MTSVTRAARRCPLRIDQSALFTPGVSCPLLGFAAGRRAGARERQRQIELAKARNQPHH